MVMAVGSFSTLVTNGNYFAGIVVYFYIICNFYIMTPEEQAILYENNKMLKKLCD